MRLWYRLLFEFTGLVLRLGFRIRVQGRENLPPGGFLAVCNHASFLDPSAAGWALDREIHYLARKTLFKPPIMNWLLPSVNVIPVDIDRPDMSALKKVIRLLRQGEIVLLFPEGARTWDGRLGSGHPGSGMAACKANVPIVPIRLFGTYEALSRTTKKLKFHPIRVVIGKPFTIPESFHATTDKEAYACASQLMMQEISRLQWLPD